MIRKIIGLVMVMLMLSIGGAYAYTNECGGSGGGCGTPEQSSGEPTGEYGSILVINDTDVYTPTEILTMTYLDGAFSYTPIIGTVFDDAGNPEEGVTVSIHSDVSGITITTETNSVGFYGPVSITQGSIDVGFTKTDCATDGDISNYTLGTIGKFINGGMDCTLIGTVTGTIVLEGTSTAIEGVLVTYGSYYDTTNSSGAYSISNVPIGAYTPTFIKDTYVSGSGSVTVTNGGNHTVNGTIDRQGHIWGFVKDHENGHIPFPGVTVSVRQKYTNTVIIASTITDVNGNYSLAFEYDGNEDYYEIWYEKVSYNTYKKAESFHDNPDYESKDIQDIDMRN